MLSDITHQDYFVSDLFLRMSQNKGMSGGVVLWFDLELSKWAHGLNVFSSYTDILGEEVPESSKGGLTGTSRSLEWPSSARY